MNEFDWLIMHAGCGGDGLWLTRKKQVVGNCNDLGWRVRSICGGSKGNTIFNLGKNEDFNWFGWVIVPLHLDVVCDEVGRAETTIGSTRA